MRLAWYRTGVANGKVISVTGGKSCNGTGVNVVYLFQPPNQPEFRGSQSVCPTSPYHSTQPNQTVPVKYLASDPSVNLIAGEGEADPPLYLAMFLFPLFGLLMFSPMFLPPILQLLRDRRIFRLGRIAQGKVVFVKQLTGASWPGFPFTSTSEIFVSFQLASGEGAEARALCRNEWLVHHLPAGASIHIAYLKNRPSRVVLLEAYVR